MYDLIVIGGGPAGVTAALRARELGSTVALVERGYLGGTGSNDGCVPVRVLAKTARALRDAQQFATYGLDAAYPKLDFRRVLDRAQDVVYTMHEKKQLGAHLRNMKVDLYENVGDAAFSARNRIRLGDGTELIGRKFILCVGGHSRRLEFPGSEHAFTYNDVWKLQKLPASLAIVGGGATGVQLASVFNTFGSQTTLLHTGPRLLTVEDESISQAIAAEFKQQGMTIIPEIDGIRRIEPENGLLKLVYGLDEQEQSVLVEAVILSVGWPGNVEKLNLRAAGVQMQGSYIKVDDKLRTTAPHIYAAGDITGRVMLVQTASHQARYAVENALVGSSWHTLHEDIPHGGFTDPEYAGVGLTEAQAREKGGYLVATVPYADMDRAVIDDHTVGFCKLVVDSQTRQIIGVHVVGEQAVEVVQIVAGVMAANMPVERLATIDFAYPTFAGIIGLAARQIALQLNLIPAEAHWQTLSRNRLAEWERTAGGTKTALVAAITNTLN
ncbi:MAG: NAD(P)/FAD-dependent oxidoreductase [Anaerolineae bacterium]|nr:NAD(P)/FAD-dependent oxidoreductase [Anaerolineae bacterium]